MRTFTELLDRQKSERLEWFLEHRASWAPLASRELLAGKLSSPAEYVTVEPLADAVDSVNATNTPDEIDGAGKLRKALGDGYRAIAWVRDSGWGVVLKDDGTAMKI